MFRIARLDRLRVFVSVPESSAQYWSSSAKRWIWSFDSVPGKIFQGKVVRTANAIDSITRTLLTEVQVENRDGKLMPGTYATVTFNNIRALPPVVVPGDTLITRSNGTMVALVRDNTVQSAAGEGGARLWRHGRNSRRTPGGGPRHREPRRFRERRSQGDDADACQYASAGSRCRPTGAQCGLARAVFQRVRYPVSSGPLAVAN